MKGKKIVDWLMIVMLVLTVGTGTKLHVVAERGGANMDHEYYIWGWMHANVALLFVGAIMVHVWQHWPWYKALRKKAVAPKARRRRINVLCLDALMVALLATGLALMPHSEPSMLGRAHFLIGFIAFLLCLAHILKRIKSL